MLEELLHGQKTTVASRWVELVAGTYAEQAGAFLSGEKDPFANPVGATLRRAAPALVEALATGEVGEEASRGLRELMRIRSVQDLTVPEAVSIVPLLRQAVLDVAAEAFEAAGPDALAELAGRTEGLLLAAFEAYAESRERLYEVRLHERDRHLASLVARAERMSSQRKGPADPGRGRPVETMES